MTREQAAEIWPKMKAFSEGKDVQWMTEEVPEVQGWHNTQSPSFEPNLKWRVRPEPRIRWVNEYSNGLFSEPYVSPEVADINQRPNRIACHKIELPPGS